MKFQLDIKSIMIGFLTATLMVSTIAFREDTANKPGKFQTATSEHGTIILDTQTGSFITATVRDFGKVQWIKGDFDETYKVSKDNKKESK